MWETRLYNLRSAEGTVQEEARRGARGVIKCLHWYGPAERERPRTRLRRQDRVMVKWKIDKYYKLPVCKSYKSYLLFIELTGSLLAVRLLYYIVWRFYGFVNAMICTKRFVGCRRRLTGWMRGRWFALRCMFCWEWKNETCASPIDSTAMKRVLWGFWGYFNKWQKLQSELKQLGCSWFGADKREGRGCVCAFNLWGVECLSTESVLS